MTAGVGATTGRLAQGVGNSVGMAIAERWLETRFNRSDSKLVDYRIYAICSDGDLMEGISQEAASVAGHLGLSNLLWIYDNNHITIEGSTKLAFSDEVGARFVANRWNVQHVTDGNDTAALRAAITSAIQEPERPSLIVLDTHIACGAPHKHDTAGPHGAPLGEDEIRLTKEFYGWPPDEHFLVPPQFAQHMGEAVDRAARGEEDWRGPLPAYRKSK